MRRHCLRWLPAVILLAVTVIAATAWATTGHQSATLLCPGVNAQGEISLEGASQTLLTISINGKTGAYHGTAHAKVTNLSGHTVHFSDLASVFPGQTKFTYTVKANGAATITVSGTLP